ncbi:MAG: MlaD family protein [Proteobacteria bacterium]|nr:MlaD family protein [Pseudomonadota bacterium]
MKFYLSYRERIAGFFLLASLVFVILFVIGAAIENQWLVPTTHYTVYVERADGLRTGSPVLWSGVNVGTVKELSIQSNSRVAVTLSIKDEHTPQLTSATRASVQRHMGIGEKRILLTNPAAHGRLRAHSLQPGSSIPLEEPRDLLEVLSSLDLGRYLDTLDRAVNSIDVVLIKLEEENRMVRMFEAFDQMGPTLTNANLLLTEMREPMISLLTDPALPRSLQGASRVFNDPQIQPMIRNMSQSFDPEKINELLDRIHKLSVDFERVLADDAPFNQSFARLNALMDDPNTDDLIQRLAHLADQVGHLTADLPQMAQETGKILKDVSIVLRALQRSWPLKRQSRKIIQEDLDAATATDNTDGSPATHENP